eukprot:1307902-Rhodomonas_salina.3
MLSTNPKLVHPILHRSMLVFTTPRAARTSFHCHPPEPHRAPTSPSPLGPPCLRSSAPSERTK